MARRWLASLPEDTAEAAGLRHSLPDWVCQLWFDAYGPRRALELCRAANIPARSVLRPNPLRAAPGEVEAALDGRGHPVRDRCGDGRDRHRPARSTSPAPSCYERGPRRRAVAELDRGRRARRGGSRASACSTSARRPGGKTAGLAAGGAHGHGRREQPGPRRGAARDARRGSAPTTSRWSRPTGAPTRASAFDAILVDAPCSGLGVLNGRPDSRWRRTPSDVEALAVLQTELLAHARELLAPGGRLVYAACTLSPDENERVPRAAASMPVSERRTVAGPGADGFYVATLARR